MVYFVPCHLITSYQTIFDKVRWEGAQNQIFKINPGVGWGGGGAQMQMKF